jgi:hypothetical protein
LTGPWRSDTSDPVAQHQGIALVGRNVNRKMTPCDNPILTPS